jgi:hypothetical protein
MEAPGNPEFKNLPELVGYLRTRLVNTGPRETLERLQELLGPNITIRYELVPLQQTGQTKNTGATGTSKTTGGSKYGHVEGNTISRILLSTRRKLPTQSDELYKQLNGLVLQYSGWKVLSVGSPILNYSPKINETVQNLSNYDIYPIIDGTVVTLYWYEDTQLVNTSAGGKVQPGSGRLSSSNGYDVTDMRWLGSRTYMEAIVELAKLHPLFSFDRLNRDCSYTIGFRHHDFHPLQCDGPKLWFIQSCNTSMLNSLSVVSIDISKLTGQSMATMNSLIKASAVKPMLVVSTRDDIGLPIQSPLQFSPDMTSDVIMQTLRKHNDNALTEFTKSLSGDFVISPHYGYFLRPRSQRHDLCDIMFESTLLTLIKSALYNFPKKRNTGESDLTPDNRMEYAKLRAYLSNTIKYPFITLFPQFQNDYARYDALFSKIADRIIQIIRKPQDKKSSDPRIEIIAQKFSAHIKDKQINVLCNEGTAIVLDFLRDKRYLEMYFTILVVGNH